MEQMSITATMPQMTDEELCHLEELEPRPEVPSFSCRVKKMEWFAMRFKQTPSNWHCLKILMGSILYKGEMQPIEVSVACPPDIGLDTTEVWVHIGKKYPCIPMLDQYDDPIRLDDCEAVQFVQKVYNRVNLGNPNFFELEKEKSDYESDYESADE